MTPIGNEPQCISRFWSSRTNEHDAALLALHLKNGGFDPKWQRADTENSLAEAVEDRRWDLVLCDLSMPRLTPFRASTASVVQSRHPALFDPNARLITCNHRYKLTLDRCQNDIVPGMSYSGFTAATQVAAAPDPGKAALLRPAGRSFGGLASDSRRLGPAQHIAWEPFSRSRTICQRSAKAH